jgi:hypothetical protein
LQPLQFPNEDEVPVGKAVNVMVVPKLYVLVQDDGEEQLIPGPVTVPVPVPAKLMVRVGCGPGGVHPRAAGPLTVILTELLTTLLEPSWKVAYTLPTPQDKFGETTPPLLTCTT